MKKSTVMFLMTNQGHGAREHMHGRRPAAFAPRGTRIAAVVRPGVRHGAGHDGRFDSDSENPNYTLVAYSRWRGGMYYVVHHPASLPLCAPIHFLIDRN